MKVYEGKSCRKCGGTERYRLRDNCVTCNKKRGEKYRARVGAAHNETTRKWKMQNRQVNPSTVSEQRPEINRGRKPVPLTNPERRKANEIARKAKKIGWDVDHCVPPRGCIQCGAWEDRWNAPHNLQILSPKDNNDKGQRCNGCWDLSKIWRQWSARELGMEPVQNRWSDAPTRRESEGPEPLPLFDFPPGTPS